MLNENIQSSNFYFSDEDFYNMDYLDEEPENPYLSNSSKGLKLISNLLSVSEQDKKNLKQIKHVHNLIDYKLLQSINKIHLENEVQLYQELMKLSGKLLEQNIVKVLDGKQTIGIGGQFSAGKSKFINSLVGEDLLPEDQVPTTSIATYLVKGDSFSAEVLTKNNRSLSLDLDAVKALSHAFYETYKLGFSHFINNLVITKPEFPYEYIAILDTPGYSKSESTKKQAVTDNEKALAQLKSVDYLIWLIDIENGAIKTQDIKFIKSLNMKTPILIVFNKCDKKTEETIKEVVEKTRIYLDEEKISYYQIVAYSSREKKEFLNRKYLQDFLDEVNRETNMHNSLKEEIKKIIQQLNTQIEQRYNLIYKRRNEIGDSIFKSEDVTEIKTLTKVYALLQQELKDIYNSRKNLKIRNDQVMKQLELLDSREEKHAKG